MLAFPASAQTLSKDSKVRYLDRAGKEESVTGIIRKETPAEIVIKPATGTERKVVSRMVLDVEYPAPSFTASKELRAARTLEQAGKLDAALKQYQDLLPKLADSPLRRHTEFTVGRLTAKLADNDPAQVKPAIERLAGYLRKNPDSWQVVHLPALLVPLQLRDNDGPGARRTLDTLAGLADLPAEQKLDCQIGSAKLLVDEKRVVEAEQKLQTLIRPLRPDDPQALRLRVALAECRAADNKAAEALKELEAILAQAKDADTKAAAYNALGDCHRRAGEPRQAMWNYLYVDVLYPQNKPEHARALYNLYQLFKELKDDNKAQQCREQLENDKQLAGKYQELMRKEK